MNKLRTVLAPAVLALVFVPLLAGCAPKPEDVCAHWMGLMTKQLGDALSPEKLAELEADCVSAADKDKNKDLKAYKNRSNCVLAAESVEDLRDCEKAEKAAKNDKQ
jgi:hypothetical protein